MTARVSGTPTLAQVATEYTVTATGSGDYSGTKTAKINITVQEDNREVLTGAFSYSFASNNITRDFGAAEITYNLTVDPAKPFSTDGSGSTITYSIDPAVDNTGISFDTTNGGLTVNSTANAQTTTYTVTASVSSSSTTHKGSVETSFTLTINPLPITALTYSPIVAFIGSPIAVASPTLTPEGASATYTIDPALPDGLTLAEDTGEISGIPTAVQTAANYKVTATASGNYSSTQTATISITVQVDTRPALTGAFSYGDASNNIIRDFGAAGDTYRPTVDPDNPFSADGLSITYSIDPAIDDTGISFDTTNGELTVNSTANAQTQSYTVTARSSTHSGPLTADFTLTINPLPITDLTYSNATITVVRGNTIPVAIPTLTPEGASATYTINPALPDGLTLSDTGEISGATAAIGAINYVVTATGSGNYSGTKTATISITVQVNNPPATVTATEIARNTTPTQAGLSVDTYRSYHALLSLSASSAGEFTLGLRASDATAPSATDLINAGGVIVRNLTTTPINVHLGFHMDIVFADLLTGTAVTATDEVVLASLLQPGTSYTLYATRTNGSSTVQTVMTLETAPLPDDGTSYITGMPLNLDSNSEAITYTIKASDPYIFIHSAVINPNPPGIIEYDFNETRLSASYANLFQTDQYRKPILNPYRYITILPPNSGQTPQAIRIIYSASDYTFNYTTVE